MWEVIKVIVVYFAGCVLFLAIVYLASGIQAKAWLDVFDKYFENKFNNFKK